MLRRDSNFVQIHLAESVGKSIAVMVYLFTDSFSACLIDKFPDSCTEALNGLITKDKIHMAGLACLPHLALKMNDQQGNKDSKADSQARSHLVLQGNTKLLKPLSAGK